MAINLPATPAPLDAEFKVQEFGGAQTGAMGGPTTLVRRLGDRMSVVYNFPAMDADCAGEWIAARMRARAEGQTIIASVPAPPFTAVIGAPEFDGAGQTGTLFNIKGLNPGAKIAKGWPFSFSDGSRLYLHLTTSAMTANGSGKGSIHISPMARVSPPDNAVLNFTAPQIEGFVVEPTSWTLSMLRWPGFSFTLAENA